MYEVVALFLVYLFFINFCKWRFFSQAATLDINEQLYKGHAGKMESVMGSFSFESLAMTVLRESVARMEKNYQTMALIRRCLGLIVEDFYRNPERAATKVYGLVEQMKTLNDSYKSIWAYTAFGAYLKSHLHKREAKSANCLVSFMLYMICVCYKCYFSFRIYFLKSDLEKVQNKKKVQENIDKEQSQKKISGFMLDGQQPKTISMTESPLKKTVSAGDLEALAKMKKASPVAGKQDEFSDTFIDEVLFSPTEVLDFENSDDTQVAEYPETEIAVSPLFWQQQKNWDQLKSYCKLGCTACTSVKVYGAVLKGSAEGDIKRAGETVDFVLPKHEANKDSVAFAKKMYESMKQSQS